MFTTYILKCKNGVLYTGMTNNLENRFKVHKSGKGSKCVRMNGGPDKFVYTEQFETKSQAMSREYAIKQLTKAQKLKLIEDNRVIV